MKRAWTFTLSIGLFLGLSMLVPFGPATEPSHVALRARHALLVPPSLPAGWTEFEAPDYWGAESTLPLARDTFVLPAAPGNHRLVLLPGARVVPGTGKLLVTVTVADGGDHPLTLSYRSADDRTGVLAFQGSGQRSLTVFEGMNDWHLSSRTRWSFEASTEASVGFGVEIRIELVRSGSAESVVRYQTLWNGGTVLTLWDERGPLEDANLLGNSPNGILGRQPMSSPRLGRTPPIGAEALRVVLYYNSTTDRSLHYRPLLSWRGADVEAPAWELTGVAPSTIHRENQNGVFEWRLPIEPRMWDDLFARSTRWTVKMDWAASPGAYHMEGDYHFLVAVQRTAPDQLLGAA